MSETCARKDQNHVYRLQQIYFYLTEDCNLRCRHCWLSPDYQSSTSSSAYLPYDLFRKIVDEAKPLGMTGVKLTGGEPLLHPQILDIIDVIRSNNLWLNIETNGVLCTPEVARAIAECKSPHVSVSLDGIDAETHEWVRGVDGCFDDALQGIRNLVDAGVRPQIIMTIMKRNKGQVREMIDFAASLKASSLKYNLVMPTSRGKALSEAGETLTLQEMVELGQEMESSTIKNSPLHVHYSHPAAFRSLSSMFGKSGNGCATCGIFGILGVLADGTYALCGIGETVPELTYGNAKTASIRDVWENAPFLKEIRECLPSQLTGVCGSCVVKNMCLGSCVAQNYYRSRSLRAPYWYCEEAKKIGLFPEKRVYSKNL